VIVNAVVHTHIDPNLTLDTVKSFKHMTGGEAIIVVEQFSAEKFKNICDKNIQMITGVLQKSPKHSIRNAFLGIKYLYENFDSNWICYTEYDALFCSDAILFDLEKLESVGVTFCASNIISDSTPNLEFAAICCGIGFKEVFRCNPSVSFLHRNFVKKLIDLGIIDRFITRTNFIYEETFPLYSYSSSTAVNLLSHLFPTLAVALDGRVANLCKWDDGIGFWSSGNFIKYKLGSRVIDDFFGACIIHPTKEYTDFPRVFYRGLRAK
jgi:hypothetical protein